MALTGKDVLRLVVDADTSGAVREFDKLGKTANKELGGIEKKTKGFSGAVTSGLDKLTAKSPMAASALQKVGLSTSQLGAIRIQSSERYKGMTRVTFTAGRRGRTDLFTRDQILRGLATQFSCGPAEVPAAIDKLRRDAAAADATITQMRSRLADALLASFPGTGRVVAEIPGREAEHPRLNARPWRNVQRVEPLAVRIPAVSGQVLSDVHSRRLVLNYLIR